MDTSSNLNSKQPSFFIPFKPGWRDVVASFDRSSWHWLAAILVCTFAIYAQTFSFDLVFDDHIQIEQNVHVRSWKYIGKAFTEHVWSGQQGYATTNSYRPFYLVWMTANYSLFGQDPRGWHVTTVLLYLGAIACVWWLAGKLVKPGPARIAATFIFALHPAHIESVAWIAAFPDSLVMIFTILAAMLYFRSVEVFPGAHLTAETNKNTSLRRSRGYAWLSAACFLLALLTKEFAIFWLPMAFVYEFFSSSRGPLKITSVHSVTKIFDLLFPHISVFVLYYLIRRQVLTVSYVGNPDLDWSRVVYTAPLILLNYFKLLVWPVHLRLEYELGYVGTLWNPWFWGPLVFLLLLAIGIYWWGKKDSLVWVLALWVVIPLLPPLNLRLLRPEEFFHDRYVFLASLGFSLLVGWGIGTLKPTRGRQQGEVRDSEAGEQQENEAQSLENQKSEIGNRKWFRLLRSTVGLRMGVLGVLVGCLVPLNLVQIPVWKNDTVLYENILKYHPNNIFALGNLSDVLRLQGQDEKEIAVLEKVMALRPKEFKFQYALARAYNRKQRYGEVVRLLSHLEVQDPTFTDQHENCFLLGAAQLLMGHSEEAKRNLEIAVALYTQNPYYWFALGDACLEQKDWLEARQAYGAVADLDPKSGPVLQERLKLLEFRELKQKQSSGK